MDHTTEVLNEFFQSGYLHLNVIDDCCDDENEDDTIDETNKDTADVCIVVMRFLSICHDCSHCALDVSHL
jgi:hypothetical protein